MRRIADFRSAVLKGLFLLDPETRTKVLAAYNYLMVGLDKQVINVEEFESVLNEATRALVGGIKIDYT